MLLHRRLFHSSFVAFAKKQFFLADIGEGIAEVEILKWHVDEGDTIDDFDEVCEVQSDKATVTITSPFAGVVTKRHFSEGDLAPTGSPLIDVEGDFDDDESEEPAVSDQQQEPDEQAEQEAPKTTGGKVLTTPTVRRMAREHNVDLALVRGSGKQGRVLKEDMVAYLAGAPPLAPSTPPTPAPVNVVAPPPVAPAPSDGAGVSSGTPPQRVVIPAASTEDRREPVRGIKRAMAASMTAAASVPWFGYSDEIDATELVKVRQQLKAMAAEHGVKLSYMPFILKATSCALSHFPILNSSVNSECTEINYRGAHNIGVAMDTPQGLLVPAVKNVASLSVLQIAQELNRLQQLGAAGKLGAEELNDVTFSISNIGNIGGTYLSPVPPPPTVAIGALGKIRKLPRFDAQGQVVAQMVFEASWRADHRIIDGADVARFSETWKALLEKPAAMLFY